MSPVFPGGEFPVSFKAPIDSQPNLDRGHMNTIAEYPLLYTSISGAWHSARTTWWRVVRVVVVSRGGDVDDEKLMGESAAHLS